MSEYFVHESSIVDNNVTIGKGTKIWHFCHIQPGAVIGEGCSFGQNVNVSNNVKIGNGCKVQNNVSLYEGVELEEYKNAVANGKFMRMRRAAWTGGTPSESPKLKRLVELTEEAYQNGNKVIIFTFFRDVIETVIETLGDRAVEPIHGGVPIGLRQDIIDDFRDSKTPISTN